MGTGGVWVEEDSVFQIECSVSFETHLEPIKGFFKVKQKRITSIGIAP